MLGNSSLCDHIFILKRHGELESSPWASALIRLDASFSPHLPRINTTRVEEMVAVEEEDDVDDDDD